MQSVFPSNGASARDVELASLSPSKIREPRALRGASLLCLDRVFAVARCVIPSRQQQRFCVRGRSATDRGEPLTASILVMGTRPPAATLQIPLMRPSFSRAALIVGCCSLVNCAYLLEAPHFYPGPSFAMDDSVTISEDDGSDSDSRRLPPVASARIVKLINSLKGTWFDATDYPDFNTSQALTFRTSTGKFVSELHLGQGGIVLYNPLTQLPDRLYTQAGPTGRLWEDSRTPFERVYVKIEDAIGAPSN